MKIFKTVKGIREYLDKQKTNTIGFVPTMGALHDGHLSLLEIAGEVSDICVSSIYVNPTQFNEVSDLKHYPRTFEQDVKKLIKHKNDVLFFPTDKEVYPDGLETKVNVELNGLADIMEGEFRPGHFEGMLQVVHRLLDIVKPDFIIMGQKDIQQARIVEQMLEQLMPQVKLIIGPIKREIDGLAMSSRNARLNPEIRDRANNIYKVLLWASEAIHSMSVEQVEEKAINMLDIPDFRPEYFTIVNAKTLKSVNTIEEDVEYMACAAVWAGEIRLIDNMYLEKK